MVFPTFCSLNLNLAIMSSWSEPQSAPGLVYADCIVSPSLAAKNIINLISVLTIWWCPCVESSLVLLEGVCYDQCIPWQNSVSLWPASFCTPRPNLPVTPGISWLLTFAFQSPMMKRTSFLVLVLECLVGLHTTIQLPLLQHYWSGRRLGLLWYWMLCFRNEQRSFWHFWDCIQVLHFGFSCYAGYSISSIGFLPTVVDVMVIWIKFVHSCLF